MFALRHTIQHSLHLRSLRLVFPGSDEFVSEKYALEIGRLLNGWSEALCSKFPVSAAERFLDAAVEGSRLSGMKEAVVRWDWAGSIVVGAFQKRRSRGGKDFWRNCEIISRVPRVETAEFQIVGIEEAASSPLTVKAQIRYEIVGPRSGAGREQHIGHWLTHWKHEGGGEWQAVRWEASEETVGRVPGPAFVDVTAGTLGHTECIQTN